MKMTVIGCYGAYPNAGGATSGYLLEEGETKILLDCGSGVLAKLQEYIPLSELDAVIITHYHPDHYADLGCLQYAAMVESQLGKRTKPFTAWGPARAEKLSYSGYCRGRIYTPETDFQIGSLSFSVMENQHEVPCFAVRISTANGKTLVYSGDTAYYTQLAGFAQNTDCFLCEASFYDAEENRPLPQHLTAGQAASLARLACAKRLVLTHLPHFGRPQQLAEKAREIYSGQVFLAQSGLQLAL